MWMEAEMWSGANRYFYEAWMHCLVPQIAAGEPYFVIVRAKYSFWVSVLAAAWPWSNDLTSLGQVGCCLAG